MAVKILTIDDSKTIRMIVARAFRPFDCEVFEASNGVEGLAVAGRDRPDIIILDLTMPVMDGYETLTKLKTDPDLKTVPVIMLTAEAGRQNVLRIAKQGVRDYLVKPFREEIIVQRVSRVLDLKPKGQATARTRRFDDNLTIMVVDDKPAIITQITEGLASTPWAVISFPATTEALDRCRQIPPDAVLVSLSLPGGAGFNFFQTLRANMMTKSVPIFAMCVRTAAEEQLRAQQIGFTGVINKPIDPDDLKIKIARALNLDSSYRYFQSDDGAIILSLPKQLTPTVVNEVMASVRIKFCEAVDAGMGMAILDFTEVESADLNLLKLGLDVLQHCQDLSVQHCVVCSPSLVESLRSYEEVRDWRFAKSREEAVESLRRKELADA